MISYIRNTVQYLDKNEKPVRFAKHTLGRRDLNMTDKVILIEIYDLCGTSKGCFAKNEYFISGFGLSESTVSRSLKRLQQSGDILISFNNGDHNDRTIKMKGVVKVREGGSQNDHPLDKGFADNDNKRKGKNASEDRSTNIETNISKDICDKSQGDIPLLAEINNAVEDLTTSNPPSASDPLPSPKTFGNPDINLAKEWLTKKYPKPLREINNRVRLKNFIQALSPRKGKDEWMSEDWKENLIAFMSVYLKEKAGWETENLFTLNQIIQAWREKGAPQSTSMANFVKTVNDLI